MAEQERAIDYNEQQAKRQVEPTFDVSAFDVLQMYLEHPERTQAEVLEALKKAIKASLIGKQDKDEKTDYILSELVGIALNHGIEPDVFMIFYNEVLKEL